MILAMMVLDLVLLVCVIFRICSGNTVGRISGVGYGIFVLTGIDSIGGDVPLVVFVPRGVESKVGQIIGSFWRPKY